MKDYPTFEAALQARVAQQNWMPQKSPLLMPTQDFKVPFIDPMAKDIPEIPWQWAKRIITVLPAVAITSFLLWVFAGTLSTGGFSAFEVFWLSLIGLTFFWISFVLSTTGAGLIHLLRNRHSAPAIPKQAMKVAVLMPIYNESPVPVFGNMAAMVAEMQGAETEHSFEYFILSDTQNLQIAAQEEQAMTCLRQTLPAGVSFYYRRRDSNEDRKTGNLKQWVTHWGGAYDAMLVLDADSLMDQQGILSLTNTLAADSALGLVQTCPAIFGTTTFFGRMQQFASAAFGKLPGHGLAAWSGVDGNFIGHNAILRTRAFAACAGLPYLRNSGGQSSLIMSHDFVEAALLRRAGWGVQMMPDISGSYEETPITLIDYIQRDRRWCQGNMQHLRILGRAGFHPISRHHMFHNALAYLMSPAWLGLVVIWALVGKESAAPSTSTADNTVFMMLFVYGMLILPKVIGAGLVLANKDSRKAFGGTGFFLVSVLTELLASMAYAPILMIQQTTAIVNSVIGRHENWGQQQRYAQKHPIGAMAWFHRYELVAGALLLIGMGAGMTSLLLLPIAGSLIGSVGLSALSALQIASDKGEAHLFASPHETQEPAVISAAYVQRAVIKRQMENDLAHPIAAE